MKSKNQTSIGRIAGAVLLASLLAGSCEAVPPEVSENAADYLKNGSFGEDGMLKEANGHLTEFVSFVTSNWAAILDNFNTVAPTLKNKVLVVAACEKLSPTDYLSFLEKLEQLSHGPSFDVKIWNGVIYPTKHKEGFLAYNHANTRVKAVIDRIKAMLPAGDAARTDVDEIISGVAKTNFLEVDAAENRQDLSGIALPP